MARKKTKRKTKGDPDTIKIPDVAYKDDFRSSVFRTNFVLSLSQAMIEFLSAVAEGCHWDRAQYCSIHKPDNWIATEGALTRRGLIRRKVLTEKERKAINARFSEDAIKDGQHHEYNYCELTPAGEAVVQLFKATDIFVESDAGARKRARRNA